MSVFDDLSNTCRHILVPVCAVLLLSLSLNILCCALRCCSGKKICQGKKRQRVRQSQRLMEENPIYGNLGYMQTSQVLFTEVDPSPSRNQARVTSDSQAKTQDCYANLALKPPVTQSGRNSPQVQYSDVVHFEATAKPARKKEPEVQEEEEEGKEVNGEEADSTDVMSIVSDLYASVQTQRTKTIDPAVEGEAYANQL